MGKYLVAFPVMIMASPAVAGEEVLYADAPPWVEVADLDTALEKDESAQALFVILDRQVKLESGTRFGYTDVAMRAISSEVLPMIARFIGGNWQPDQGDFIVHRLEIIRGDEVIKPLENGLRFETIRREKNLGKNEINGVLTATAQLEDIQIGDIVRFSVSTTQSNPALGGNVGFYTGMVEQEMADWNNQLRIIWPKSEYFQWKNSLEDHPYELSETGGYNDLRLEVFVGEQDKMPGNAPARYRYKPFLEMTSFRSWQDVSSTTADLYQTDGTIPPGSPLADEVNVIASKTQDPMERTALALQLVQDKVRYLYKGLDFGNYTPQSPTETWQLRYGDCKAKTLLLLAILDELGIDAEPVLTNTKWKDAVVDRLPGFQVFDHILVRAEIDGKTLWLDGTLSGTRMADLADAPGHRYVLPVRKSGAELEAIAMAPVGRPFHNVQVHYDLSAGTALPAIYDLKVILRTDQAKGLATIRGQYTEEKFRETVDELAAEYVVGELVSTNEFTYDEETGEGVLNARGISYLDWKVRLGRKRQELWNILGNIKLDADRSKAEWREVPVAIGYPAHFREVARFTLPHPDMVEGEQFTLAGKYQMDENLAGYRVQRDATISDNILFFNESYQSSQWEIAADALPLEKKKLAAAKKKKIALVAPKSLMEDWQQVELAKRTGTADVLVKAFDQLVERNPEDEDAYEQRAYLYQLLGDYEKATADLARSLEIKPDPAVYNWRAELLFGTDRPAAIADLQKALEIDPIHWDALTELVDIYVEDGKSERAQAVVEKSRAKGLADEQADKLTAIILQSRGDQDDADVLLGKLIDDDPESLSLLNERCWLRGRGNFKLEEALDDCTEAVELAQKPSTYLDSRALVYYRLGMYDDALADLNRALRLSPDMTTSRYLRALVHKAKGDMDAAENDHYAALHLYRYVSKFYDRFGMSFE